MDPDLYSADRLIETLAVLLRVAGGGLILLAIMHIPVARKLQWRTDAARLMPPNAAIFKVHAFFICLVLVIMGLPCLLEPAVFLNPSRAGLWITSSYAGFWSVRLYCQWFVYPWELWRGKRLESWLHGWFTLVWAGLAALFGACALVQAGWLG